MLDIKFSYLFLNSWYFNWDYGYFLNAWIWAKIFQDCMCFAVKEEVYNVEETEEESILEDDSTQR